MPHEGVSLIRAPAEREDLAGINPELQCLYGFPDDRARRLAILAEKQVLPVRPWLSSLLVVHLRAYRSRSQPKRHPGNPFDKARAPTNLSPRSASALLVIQVSLKFNARVRGSADPKSVGFEIADGGMRRLMMPRSSSAWRSA